jgi:phage-related protein
VLLRKLPQGKKLGLPQSRPMPGIGPRGHELRVPDATGTWRIVYRVAADAVLIAEVFAEKTETKPHHVIQVCRRRLRAYDEAVKEG